MTAPATYSFEHEITHQMIVLYIHDDNWPERAAQKFWRMYQRLYQFGGIAYEISMGFLAENFIRATENAIFTNAHTDHNDSDYHYSIDKEGQLTVEKCYSHHNELTDHVERLFNVVYKGHYTDFINRYCKNVPAIYSFIIDNHDFYMTLFAIEEYVSLLKSCVKNTPPHCQERLEKWEAAYQAIRHNIASTSLN